MIFFENSYSADTRIRSRTAFIAVDKLVNLCCILICVGPTWTGGSSRRCSAKMRCIAAYSVN